jgi:hypothetical protein
MWILFLNIRIHIMFLLLASVWLLRLLNAAISAIRILGNELFVFFAYFESLLLHILNNFNNNLSWYVFSVLDSFFFKL